jgi:hypothetical protein
MYIVVEIFSIRQKFHLSLHNTLKLHFVNHTIISNISKYTHR